MHASRRLISEISVYIPSNVLNLL